MSSNAPQAAGNGRKSAPFGGTGRSNPWQFVKSLGCWGWLKRWFCTEKMAAQQREAEKQHQAAIRRELRGLPADPRETDQRNA